MVIYIGDYIREEKLGRGSFASVYKGRHKVTNDIVAIKDIAVQNMPTQYLELEISIMKEMSHSCIVELLDCIRTDSHVYLIMEYCSLGDLSSFLVDNYQSKGMPEADLIHFLDQMASALIYLRQRNCVHRDIKPQNILLVPGNHGNLPDIKISDFGFAKFLPNADLTNSYCGSPLYMAPEVISRKKYDSKADLWSVGVLLYEMMTGRKMIETIHMHELKYFLNNYNDRVNFYESKNKFSRELKELISLLLKKNPKERITCELFYQQVQLLLPDKEDDYVVINTSSHASIDSMTSIRYSTSAPSQRRSFDPSNQFSFQDPSSLKRKRKFSVGSASSVFSKAISIASTKLFGSGSENNSPPSPLTPATPFIEKSILIEEMTLENLLISCKDTMETERIIEMVSAIEEIRISCDKDQVPSLNLKIKSLLLFAINAIVRKQQQEPCSSKLIDLKSWMKNKLNEYQDPINLKETNLSVESILYDKALELSRSASVKQLIHEDLNDCIHQFKQSILILESIIIDESSQTISNNDQAIIQKLIDSLQSRVNNVLV